jgi:hypothetical protein
MELHGVVEEPRALANDCRLNREADVLFATVAVKMSYTLESIA